MVQRTLLNLLRLLLLLLFFFSKLNRILEGLNMLEKSGNGEQYAFKKVNKEERVIVIYMCQTCCQLVALCP